MQPLDEGLSWDAAANTLLFDMTLPGGGRLLVWEVAALGGRAVAFRADTQETPSAYLVSNTDFTNYERKRWYGGLVDGVDPVGIAQQWVFNWPVMALVADQTAGHQLISFTVPESSPT